MPRDFSVHAAMVVKMATGQSVEPEPEPPVKNPHAVALERLGGL
ncbi:MAG: hypothetical protein WA005_17225 [Candidatus Binataceae bacterium]